MLDLLKMPHSEIDIVQKRRRERKILGHVQPQQILVLDSSLLAIGRGVVRRGNERYLC